MTIPRKGFFITASDTNVGKTWIACQLVKHLLRRGHSVKVRKPVESGCQKDDQGRLSPDDGRLLQNAAGNIETLDIITPYRYPAAVAPDRAARLKGESIHIHQLYDAVVNGCQDEDMIIAEGAGGFYSPLAEDGLNSDLARQLDLPVIIVAPDRLGGINQALLTLSAVEKENLDVHAIVLNQNQASQDPDVDNLESLKKLSSVPVFYCGYEMSLESAIVL